MMPLNRSMYANIAKTEKTKAVSEAISTQRCTSPSARSAIVVPINNDIARQVELNIQVFSNYDDNI